MKIYDDKSRVASERNIWIKRGYAMADLSSIQFSFRYTNRAGQMISGSDSMKLLKL